MTPLKILFGGLLLLTSIHFSWGEESREEPSSNKQSHAIYIIPIQGVISKTQLYILRRELKQAIQDNAEAILLDIDTPGGDLATTLEMMEMLDNFRGLTMTYVNDEAISAGAYISASTQNIYFKPTGIIGSAAVIQGSGADIPETVKMKIDSYLRARVRSLSEEYKYRADVVRAMMDKDFVLELDGVTIKKKDELLTLTATEAMQLYGNPPETLLGAGVYENLDDLLTNLYPEGNYVRKDFVLSWSEDLAKWLNTITPILLGVGMLLLFIEFKTSGFGIFGAAGLILLLIVFASNYIAGLAGYEEILFFVLGLVLLSIELFVIPGTLITGITGIGLVLGSIIWALADIWPTDNFQISPDLFLSPIVDLTLGLAIAVVGGYILGRFLLKSWFSNYLVLKTNVSANTSITSTNHIDTKTMLLPGAKGIVTKTLRPSGQIEVEGNRYEAHVCLGTIKQNANIEVIAVKGLSILVKELKS